MNKYLIILVVLLMACCLSTLADEANIEYVNSFGWTHVHDIKIESSTAYCLFLNGLIIFDISDSSSPEELSRLYLPGNYTSTAEYSLIIENNYAYITRGKAGLCIVDINDPAQPELVTSFMTPTIAYGIDLMDDYAVVCGSGGLYLIDISDPENPMLESRLEPRGGNELRVSGHYAFVASRSEGMLVFNLNNPQTIELINGFPDNGGFHQIEIAGDYAFLDNYYMIVLDISDPYEISLVGEIETTGCTSDIAIVDNLAFVARSHYGMTILDITDPANPAFVGGSDQQVTADQIEADGNIVITAAEGINLFDVSTPSSPELMYSYSENQNDFYSVIAEQNILYAGGFHIYDISDIQAPIDLNRADFSVQDMALADDYTFFACGSDGLKVFDTSDPENFSLVYSDDRFLSLSDISIVDDQMYLADNTEGLKVYDISDREDPQFLWDYVIPHRAINNIVVDDTIAFISVHEHGLQIVNFSNPDQPAIIYEITEHLFDTPYEVVLGDGFAYLTLGWNLIVFDIADLSNPILADSVHMRGDVRKMDLVDNYLFLANEDLSVFDVSDPYNIIELGYCMTPGRSRDVIYHNEHIFLADGASVTVFRLNITSITDDPDPHLPSSFVLSQNYPNPFNASTTIRYELPITSRVKVDIYDILGRNVESLVDRIKPAGYHQVTWHADDLPSGVYFYKIQAGELSETNKMLLVK